MQVYHLLLCAKLLSIIHKVILLMSSLPCVKAHYLGGYFTCSLSDTLPLVHRYSGNELGHTKLSCVKENVTRFSRCSFTPRENF